MRGGLIELHGNLFRRIPFSQADKVHEYIKCHQCYEGNQSKLQQKISYPQEGMADKSQENN